MVLKLGFGRGASIFGAAGIEMALLGRCTNLVSTCFWYEPYFDTFFSTAVLRENGGLQLV